MYQQIKTSKKGSLILIFPTFSSINPADITEEVSTVILFLEVFREPESLIFQIIADQPHFCDLLNLSTSSFQNHFSLPFIFNSFTISD